MIYSSLACGLWIDMDEKADSNLLSVFSLYTIDYSLIYALRSECIPDVPGHFYMPGA